MIDPRVSEIMAESQNVRLTWPRAQMGLDLAEYNRRLGGTWSRGTQAGVMGGK